MNCPNQGCGLLILDGMCNAHSRRCRRASVEDRQYRVKNGKWPRRSKIDKLSPYLQRFTVGPNDGRVKRLREKE